MLKAFSLTEVIALSFFAGALLYLTTSAVHGCKKAAGITGGAISMGFLLHPFYVALLASLLGHMFGILFAKYVLKKEVN